MDRDNNTHKLPAGWIWTALEAVSLPISRMNRNYQNQKDEFSYIDIEAIDNQKYKLKTPQIYKWGNAPSRAQHKLNVNDILIATVRPYLKNIALIPPHDVNYIASTGFCVIRPILIEPKYVYYFVLSQSFIDSINKKAKGTSYPAVSNKTILSQNLALPPVKEQLRIVQKIEELFSELDHAEAILKKARKQLEIYKQVLLKCAFEGKLTNKNIEDGKLPEEWKWIKVSDICNVVRGGSPRPAGDSRYYNGNIPFLKVKDITKNDNMYLNTYEFTIKEAGLKKTRQITRNTLLLSNSGATLGVPKICMIDATLNDGIAAFLNLDSRSIMYMYYFWLSKTRELRSINMGAAQPNLNTIIIKNYDIPFCSFDEQSKIVQELGSKFALIENLENTIDKGLKKLDTFRQSILKNAYEGKLVPQYSSDEPANKLLQQIIQEKVNFSENIKAHLKLQPKIKKMIEDNRSITDILKEAGKPVPTKELWQSSEFKDNIDAFYAQLKKLIENNTILEIPRQGKETFIKLIQENENR